MSTANRDLGVPSFRRIRAHVARHARRLARAIGSLAPDEPRESPRLQPCPVPVRAARPRAEVRRG